MAKNQQGRDGSPRRGSSWLEFPPGVLAPAGRFFDLVGGYEKKRPKATVHLTVKMPPEKLL